jgi:hypothetical protein
MSNNLLRKPRSMGNLLPPNYISDEGRFDLNLPRIRPAWLMNESIQSLDGKFPMVPAPTGSIVFYTTPLGEKVCLLYKTFILWIDNSHYRLILKLGKEMQINHHS